MPLTITFHSLSPWGERKHRDEVTTAASLWVLAQRCSMFMSIELIQLAHGSGGSATLRLFEQVFLPHFRDLGLQPDNDAALLSLGNDTTLAFTIDGFVVDPPFFPGGDLGILAINGTGNDLAVMGAKPLWMACSFIISAGTATATLERVVESMEHAAKVFSVQLVAGDTKVVESKGAAPQILITTAGLGILEVKEPWHVQRIRPGDELILSGTIGEHTLAVLGARHGWFERDPVTSDCAFLYPMLRKLHSIPDIHWARDVTRGGLGGIVNELAKASGYGIELYEKGIPISDLVASWCEMMGYDPLHLANEGKVLLSVDPEASPRVLAALQNTPLGKNAAPIGHVMDGGPPLVVLNTAIGGRRLVPAPSGELFPRIC